MADIVRAGERVLLCQGRSGEKTYVVELQEGGVYSSHLGNFPHDQIVGKSPGQWIYSHLGKPMLLLRPSTRDQMMKVRRKTTIVYPKEAGQILITCGIVPGTRVLEVGTGSGSLTIALALAVGETGHIYSWDVREDHSKQARKNVEKAGLSERVDFGIRGPGEDFDCPEVDVAILDVPQPWNEIEAVCKTLKLGGRLVSLTPTYNQIERFAEVLEESGFAMIEAEELLARRILARPGRTRPDQRMVGHTEFLLFGTRAEQLDMTLPTTAQELRKAQVVAREQEADLARQVALNQEDSQVTPPASQESNEEGEKDKMGVEAPSGESLSNQ